MKGRRLNTLRFAGFQALLFALIGGVCGIVYSFGGLLLDALVSLEWISSSETPGLSIGTILAFGALLGMPLLFLVSGFILGIFEAILFNLTSKWFWNKPIEFES